MGLATRLQSNFVAGLLLLAPLAITAFVLQFAFVKLFGVLEPFVRTTRLTQYTANIEIAAQVLAVVLIVLFVVAIGFLADLSVGQRVFGGFDRVMGLVPMVSVIYSGVRQVGNALAERDNRYQSVVLVEIPRERVYSIGFVTGEAPAPAREVAGETMHNVFVPNSPNPTGGRLLLVPDDRVHETSLTVREGLRLVVTTGITSERDELDELDEMDGLAPTRATGAGVVRDE